MIAARWFNPRIDFRRMAKLIIRFLRELRSGVYEIETQRNRVGCQVGCRWLYAAHNGIELHAGRRPMAKPQ
jgi:hypothetical protein